MKIKLVTWDGDLTQFLVYADDNASAIKKAINANLMLEYDKECADLNNMETYTVEDVDLYLLNEIIHRNDCLGVYGDAIVFND